MTTFAVIDFETTGLNPQQGDRVIEVGVSLMRQGREVDTFSALINPGIPIPSFITGLTGISNDMVRAAPRYEHVLPEVQRFIGDAHLVAHNAGFDRRFWRHEHRLCHGRECQREFVCTLMLARRIFQSWTSHRLGELAHRLGIETGRSHRALDDARVTTQLLSMMLERLQTAQPDEAIDAAYLYRYQRRPRAQLPDLTYRF